MLRYFEYIIWEKVVPQTESKTPALTLIWNMHV